MASASSPPPWGGFLNDNEKLDLKFVHLFVTLINHHMHALLADNKAWKVFKSRCTSKLQIPPDGGGGGGDEEEHSVLSNLYWGLHTIEAANKAKWPEEKISRLHASEKMLQIPAALDEHGVTAGIPNHQLLACSYYYLSLLWKLQEDEWQVAIHFLQALTLSPTLIHTELAPQLCKTLCRLSMTPCLLDVICTSNSYEGMLTSLLLTPPAASLMIIEVLVTAHDYTTNNLHLSAISSPRVLSGLLDAPRNNNLEEIIALASVLVRCMQFDGKCRKHISHLSPPVAPFITLLSSNSMRATSIALEYFHELLCIPRSSAVNVLHQIQKEGSINNMCVLSLLQNSQPQHKPLAASLLLQLSMLEEISSKLINSEKAIEAFLESLMREENSAAQKLSAFILSNLGGTYSWMGEPYTIPWLVKKAGLTSMYHRNMIKNFDFSDESLQDVGIDAWCGKLARCILKFGVPVFHALEKGLKSKSKSISRDCLVIATWLGSEVTKGTDDLRYAACEILLSTIEQYVHPGLELEERLLACLCIYYYTSGRGMKKLVNFSEGVRESLRRLSNITWMAEELLKVADYIQPNKWRISCVHTQILEVCQSQSGAVTALIYYKGHLFSGHADGSIKVWDIKGQTASLVQVTKEHKRAVTCFSLSEPGNWLLSGSFDKRIKVWQMVQGNIECIETIVTKDSIRRISTHGDVIFIITHSNKLKMFDVSRKSRRVFKNKSVSFATAAQGKLYVGCTDSSIQELAITTRRQQEIKAPSNRWRWRNKTVNSIFVYKDWLYCAIANVEGSHIKEWKRNNKPHLLVMPEKGANVSAMEIVEDFIYFISSASKSSLQIWLRGTQHKVGRLSAGSKITSLLSANDMILCGTETGMIKGWIPL